MAASRREYEEFAALCARVSNSTGSIGVETLAHIMADIFAKHNPRFDREKFMAKAIPPDSFVAKADRQWRKEVGT